MKATPEFKKEVFNGNINKYLAKPVEDDTAEIRIDSIAIHVGVSDEIEFISNGMVVGTQYVGQLEKGTRLQLSFTDKCKCSMIFALTD